MLDSSHAPPKQGQTPKQGEHRGRQRRRADAGGRDQGTPATRFSGGRYAPLPEADVRRIDAAVLEILGDIGLSGAPPAIEHLVTAGGGTLGADGRLLFPADLVQRTLYGLAHTVTLHGQAPGHELELGGSRVHVGTGGAAPLILDPETGAYRPSTPRDLYDAARLVDTLEHIHFFDHAMPAFDLDTAFACLAGTTKHVCVSAASPASVAEIAALCYAIAGSAAAFRARPFLSLMIDHVVPPLRFSSDACEMLVTAARHGIPVHVNTFGQLGVSSPVTIAGCLAQTLAETLAGMVIAWLAAADVKAIFGPRPMITDPRTKGMAGGSGEQALLTAACVQMAQYYGLPNSTIAGATDSKVPDAQSGYEKALTVTLAAQAGCNMITQAAGMQAALTGCSLESYVIDNDMLGAILRSLAPVEIGDATLSPALIGAVARGEDDYRDHPTTRQRMSTDFLTPRIADRRSVAEWAADGSPDIRRPAAAQVKDILSRHFPNHLSPALQRRLRARFDITLAPEAMTP